MVNLGSLIKEMKSSGKNNSQIIEELKRKGHSSQDIYDSFNKQGNIPASDLEAPAPGEFEADLPQSQEMGYEQDANSYPQEEPQEEYPMPDMPSSLSPHLPQRQAIEQIEEISEAIVEEKLQEFSSSMGDIAMWKERTNAEMNAMKQEIIRIRNHVENLQVTMIGKVEDYNKSVNTLSIEMKALSKVMEKIIQPLTMNVKDLSRIVDKFKKVS